MRVRLIYSKRGGACFVPHIALAQIFSRASLRAGFKLSMTQGFSPRAKISFGPELPAGVVALNEPVDLYFADEPSNIITALNASLPEGFAVSKVLYPPEDSPNLGKSCKHAEYLLRTVNNIPIDAMASEFYGQAVRENSINDGWLRLILNDPAQNPIGGFVKHLVREDIIAGWHEINIVRISVGIFDEKEGRVLMNA